MVEFIRTNPVLEGMQAFEAQQDRAQARALRAMQVEDAQRRRGEEQSAAQALQGIYASGRPTPDAWERAAGAPGLGARTRIEFADRGRQLRQDENARRDKRAKDMVDFLKGGFVEAAKAAATDIGLEMPPQFWADRTQHQALIERYELEAKKAESEERQARAAYYRGEGRQSGGRSSVFQQKLELYRRAYPDASEAEILDMADGRKRPNIIDLRARAHKIASEATDLLGRKLYRTPEEVQRAADETLQYLMGPVPIHGAAAPAAPAAAPATPPQPVASTPTPQQPPPPAQRATPAAQRTPEQVRADFRAGRITREQARAELQRMGFD